MSGEQEDKQEATARSPELPAARPQAQDEAAAAEAVTLPSAQYEELKALAGERDEYLRRLQRAVADYQNLQKRVEKFRQSAREALTRSLAQEILPVADGLALALEAAAQVEGAESIAEGLRLVEKSFYSALEKLGVRPLEAVGRPFDPHYHEAAAQEQADGVAPNTVIREVKKGFVMGDMVIRPSRVVVARGAAGLSPAEADGPLPGETAPDEGPEQGGAAGPEEWPA
jgi:molecular chaperone GrpE